jgi:nicotinamidase-related amidase
MSQGPTRFIEPSDTVLLLVDCQPGSSLAAESRGHQALVDNVVALTRTALVFDIPLVATTAATERFSGPVWPALAALLTAKPMERRVLNAYADEGVRSAIQQTDRKLILVAGLLTEACVTFPALSLPQTGHEVFVVGDCCAGSTQESHGLALDRLSAAGVGMTSWVQLLLEWQGDWTRSATYAGATGVLGDLGGAYGLALRHAKDMLTSPAAQAST